MGIDKNSFKSKSMEYETPNYIFNPLREEFDLQLDVCASIKNHKLNEYFTKETDGLSKDWNKNFWMNPPFGREIKKWVIKAREEAIKHKVTGVLILPVRSNTIWWHNNIIDAGAEVRFLKGEIKFNDCERGLWLPFAIIIMRGSPLA